MITLTRAVAFAVGIAAAGCVTTEIGPEASRMPSGAPVLIPLGGSGGHRPADPVTQYYESALMLMHDAVLERNPERLDELCSRHDRAGAPAAVRGQIERFRRLARVLEFERAIARRATVELRGDDVPALGERVPLAVECPILPGSPIVLGDAGGETRATFQVRVRIEDLDCFGGSVERSFGALVAIPRAIALGEQPLRVPFDLDAIPPEGVIRKLRVEASLLPGHVRFDGERLPCQRIRLATRELELFPQGIDVIHAEPLKTLRNALRSTDPKHLEHAFLAARAMPASARQTAYELLVGQVRDGTRARSRTCMAALREMTGIDISVEDRAGWLRWWAERTGHTAESR